MSVATRQPPCVPPRDTIGNMAAYKITDSSGRILITGKTEDNKIDVNALENGIFIIQIILENHSIVTKRFLKWKQ